MEFNISTQDRNIIMEMAVTEQELLALGTKFSMPDEKDQRRIEDGVLVNTLKNRLNAFTEGLVNHAEELVTALEAISKGREQRFTMKDAQMVEESLVKDYNVYVQKKVYYFPAD